MGFVNITCAVCKGLGQVGFPYLQGCTNCNGTGSVTVHAGNIGSYIVSTDPRPNDDTIWATLWKLHDDGTIEIKDISKVEAFRPDK